MELINHIHLTNLLAVKTQHIANYINYNFYSISIFKLNYTRNAAITSENRMDIIERQTKDMNTQIASSSDYTTQALRAMNPPKTEHQHLT